MYKLTIPEISEEKAKLNLARFQKQMKGSTVSLRYIKSRETAIYKIEFIEALKSFNSIPVMAKLMKVTAHKAEKQIRAKYPKATMEYVR